MLLEHAIQIILKNKINQQKLERLDFSEYIENEIKSYIYMKPSDGEWKLKYDSYYESLIDKNVHICFCLEHYIRDKVISTSFFKSPI